MVGSDQVWNPNASSSIEPYFLTFAPHSALTVSYASSFGVSKIENNSIANRINLDCLLSKPFPFANLPV